MADKESITSIKGIGDKTARLFHKLGIDTVDELLTFFPRTYVQYPEPARLKDFTEGEQAAVRLFISEDFLFRKVRSLNIGTGKASDGENEVQITFFNTPYYRAKLVRGASYIFYGKLQLEYGRYRMEQPFFYTEAEYLNLRSSLQPVYSLTKGLSNRSVQKAVVNCIESGAAPYVYEEYLPEDVREAFELTDRRKALFGMHYPESLKELEKARNRLVFDEILEFLVLIRSEKDQYRKESSPFTMIETADASRLLEKLPYSLTGAQEKVYHEIAEDLTSGYVMNRLVQGDVGSGKTIVAILALLLAASNGLQGAMMAPTEILARQHFENVSSLTEKYDLPFKPVLLTGSVTAKNKREIYEKIRTGEANLVIGTHALIQDKVEFKDLALVVTDEQHRFGVRQRENLSLKGRMPHILVMSATPIPRTLSIVIFGDLSVSVIDEKPSMRLPVKNCVVGPEYRDTAYKFMVSEIRKGHQIYIICPLVEESEELSDVSDVVSYTQKLRKILPETIRIDFLHGRMKADAKQNVMERFLSRDIDILVSTTVVEVGVDVPNATVMLIENAERFGLSALHQLRGRIGRGDAQSYCIFLNGDKKKDKNERLEVLNHTNDGFEVAKEDLKMRGSGDLFGIRQSGETGFRLADLYEDAPLFLKINELLDKDKRLFDIVHKAGNKYIDFRTI